MKTVSLKNQMLWNSAGNLIYMGCQWLVTILVANLGTFEEAGILSVAMSVSATFQTVALFGIRSYQISDLEKKYTDTSYVFLRGITCLSALIACMVFSLVNGYFGGQLLSIFLFMLFRLAENYSDVLHGIAQKNDRLDIAGKSFAVKGIGLLAVFLAGYRLVGSLNAGLFGMAFFSLLSTALYDWAVIRRLAEFSPVGNFGEAFRLGKNTVWLCVYSFLFSAMSTVPKLILEKVAGEELLGIYSSIFAPALLISAMAGYLYNPFVPSFARYYGEKKIKEFTGLFVKITVSIVSVAAVVLLCSQLLGEFALKLLLGEKILPYVSFLDPILIAIFLNAFLGFLCMLAVTERKFAVLLAGCGIGAGLCLLSGAPMIHRFGANGASYSLIISTAVAAVVLLLGTVFFPNNKKREG